MSGHLISRRAWTLDDLATLVAYAALGTLMLVTHLVGLGRSYWHDEVVTIRDFVNAGPSGILAGTGVNHELYSLLLWITTSLVGESEVVTRAWSVIPFILGSTLVTGWLHVRLNRLSAVLFLCLAAISPLLLDITRQARGYGLAFLAMAVLMVAAMESERRTDTWVVIAMCVAGVVGTLTLVNFGVAFASTVLAVLVFDRGLRRRLALGLTASSLVVIAWYLPARDALSAGSEQVFGRQISTAGLLSGPFDKVLIPAFALDGRELTEGMRGLSPVVLVVAFVVAGSPLLHTIRSATTLSAGVVGTMLALWVTGTHTVPRFLSFLLVPMFVALSTGAAASLRRPTTSRLTTARFAASLTVIVSVAIVSASPVWQVVRLPREAHKEVARLIEGVAPPQARVHAYMLEPEDVAFYSSRPVIPLLGAGDGNRLCADGRGFVLVVQLWRLAPINLDCTDRPGTKGYVLRQYARGKQIRVWVIPNSSVRPGA